LKKIVKFNPKKIKYKRVKLKKKSRDEKREGLFSPLPLELSHRKGYEYLLIIQFQSS
jgi:hypothetical protein